MKTLSELPIHTAFAIFSTKNYGFDLGVLQSRKCMIPYFKIKYRFYEYPATKIYQSMINQQQWGRTLPVQFNEDVPLLQGAIFFGGG